MDEEICGEGKCVKGKCQCDDGNACTKDSCENKVCHNVAIDCEDGARCTRDVCDAKRAQDFATRTTKQHNGKTGAVQGYDAESLKNNW